MQVQPIANFEQRMTQYRQEMRDFVLLQCPWLFMASLTVSLGFMYVATHSSFQGIPPMQGDWRLLGLLAAVALMIPPIAMMKPECPTPGDVAADQALRRAMGMDDSVSAE